MDRYEKLAQQVIEENDDLKTKNFALCWLCAVFALVACLFAGIALMLWMELI
jgi:hypothetical protein